MPDAATRAYNRLEEAHKKPLDAAIIRRMWDYLRPHRRAVLVNVGLALLGAALELVVPKVVRHLIDVDIKANQDFTAVLGSLAVLFVLFVARWPVTWFSIRRNVTLGESVVRTLRNDIVSHLQRHSMEWNRGSCHYRRTVPALLGCRKKKSLRRQKGIGSLAAYLPNP